MKAKGIIAAICCGALMVSLAGCGTKTAMQDGMTTVTVWTGDGGSKAFMTKAVDEWNKTTGKEKGIYIEYTVQEGNMGEKLDLALSSGKAPDMFGGGNLAQLVANDQIVALEDMPGGPEMIAAREKYITEDSQRFQGKTYRLPVSVTTHGLIYNKDMFVAAGIVDENGEAKAPETLEEMVEAAKKLTNPSKKEYGIIYPGKWSSWYDLDITKVATATDGFPVGYNPKTGWFDYSGQAEVMKAIIKIKENGSCFPGTEGIDNDAARSRFALGNIGMKMGASYDYGVLTEQFPTDINWGVAPFPSADKNVKHRQFMNISSSCFINKASVEQIGEDKLMEVYKWLAGDEMIINMYKEGLALPYDSELVEGIEIPDEMENWKIFAEMEAISQVFVMPRLFDVAGEKELYQVWLEDIWTGNIPYDRIDEVAKEKADMMNKAIDRYQELHPEYEGQKYILSDWDTRR
ncbi:MAG: extracellular solute-binding protein [Clostridia bacterium]|nr:extracellular solute-binding protein [Clostridia bacterium]